MLHRQRFFDGPLGPGYDVVVCGECGAGFADGIPTQDELDRYYAERSKYTYAHAGGAESPYDFKRFELIADQLEQCLPSKQARILDVGCATGGLLAVLKRRGYGNVFGSDPAPACAEAARRLHGIEVRTATLAEHADWSERFDAILLVGVLEHLREACAAVRTVAGLLKPGGMVYCAQPDVEAFADCENAPYQQFSVEHVNFFSRHSLNRLMGSAGLKPNRVWRWMVEWREGITDSVVSGVYAQGPAETARDQISAPALRTYLERCAAHEADTLRQIEDLVRSQEPMLIWGAGTLTRRLLATTSLAQANVVAFVDSSPSLVNRSLAGKPILAPGALGARPELILICSRVFREEIRRMIQQDLQLPNRIMTLA